MKSIDLQLQPPQLKNPDESKQMAAMVAKLQEILQFIVDNLGTARVVTSAPAAGELEVVGDNKGNVLSEIVILDDATQSNRKLYYKNSAGTLRLIDSA